MLMLYQIPTFWAKIYLLLLKMNGIYIEMHIFPCRINDSVSPIYHTTTQIDGTTNFIYMYSLVHYHVNPNMCNVTTLNFFVLELKDYCDWNKHKYIHGFQALSMLFKRRDWWNFNMITNFSHVKKTIF